MMVSSASTERVTVTMPADLVADIDRLERNRSRFITEAVRRELRHRQHLDLLRSLEDPHPDTLANAALGLERWGEELPAADSDLLDPTAGVPVHWDQQQGWQEPAA